MALRVAGDGVGLGALLALVVPVNVRVVVAPRLAAAVAVDGATFLTVVGVAVVADLAGTLRAPAVTPAFTLLFTSLAHSSSPCSAPVLRLVFFLHWRSHIVV